LIEEKSSGVALLQVAKQKGIPAVGIKPKDPKNVRLQIVSSLIENGTILFPRHTPWIDGLISELVRFPQCAYSDQVDALSQALAWLQQRLSKVLFEFDFCTSSDHMGPIGPFSKRHFFAGCFSSLAC
jgi:phage terminase large subunit-like protein